MTRAYEQPTSAPNESAGLWRGGMGIVVALAAVKLALHLFANRGYGYFRDELYYLACAEHLDWGYVDQPPLVAVCAWLSRSLLGESLSAIRFLPALAGAAKVLLTGLLVRELGGGRLAQALACVAVLVAPAYLIIDNFLSMNAFEPLAWMGCVYLLLRILKTGNEKLWLAFGALAGLGLQNKHSTLFFGFAVVVAMLLTPERRLLARRWIWIGGALALLIFLPNLVWQVQHGFPTYELLKNVKETGKNIVLGPAGFLGRQLFMMNPFAAPLWLAGVWYFLFQGEGRRFRVFGLAYLALLVTFFFFEAKDYYVAPYYPLLFAAGGVALEPWLARRRAAAVGAFGVLTASGLLAALLSLPLLPVERLLALQRAIGYQPPRSEVSHTSELPQHLSDQFGWEELTREVARIYHALPPGERARTAIFGNNYGQAGAIDFFGPRYGLPRAISGHQNYFFWGPREYTGESVIVLGSNREDLEGNFEEVIEAGATSHPHAMPEENRPIYFCRRLRAPLADAWPQVKRWR
jgi:hypothetical protein